MRETAEASFLAGGTVVHLGCHLAENPSCSVSPVGAPTGAPYQGGICHGDSGGPVFQDLGGGRALQLGIVSIKGPGGCGRGLSGYIDVAALRDWIDDGVLLLTRDRLTAQGKG